MGEFDILKGNTIGARWPPTASLVIDDEVLACLCLPDGAHIHEEDKTMFLIHPTPPDSAAAPLPSVVHSVRVSSQTPLFATSVFINIADESVDRGAIQLSMVAVARCPLFAEFGGILRHAVALAADLMRGRDVGLDGIHSRQDVLAAVYRELNRALQRELQVSVLGKTFHIGTLLDGGSASGNSLPLSTASRESNAEPVHLDETLSAIAASADGGSAPATPEPEWPVASYTGISLSALVRAFGPDTMVLWYALLLRRRVLFTGQPAQAVCNLVLAAPLLVAPLESLASRLAPYVCLQDTTPLDVAGGVCGSTNLLFATREEWYDVHGSLTTGSVACSSASSLSAIKPGSGDRKFIKNVLAGLSESRSEAWIRVQFANHTRAFLAGVEADTLRGTQAKYLSSFVSDELYRAYLVQEARRAAVAEANGSASEAAVSVADIRALVATLAKGDADVAPVRLQHMLFELDKVLSDVLHLEEVVRLGGVSAVTPFLSHGSAQVRKYAVSVLGKLAVSLPGQLALLQLDAVGDVLALVDDSRANVADAAAKCVLRMAQLFVGAQALVRASTLDICTRLVLAKKTPLTVRTSAARVLLEIYEQVPGVPVPAEEVIKAFHLQLYLESPELKVALYLLLDMWGASLPALPWTERVNRFLNALCVEDQLTRTDASCHILAQLGERRELALEFVARGGIEVVLQNLRPVVNIDILVTASFCLLTRLAATALGRRRMLHLLIVPKATTALGEVNPALAFVAAELLETLSQFEETAELVVADGGLEALAAAVVRALADPHVRALALPALTALRNIALFVPSAHPLLAEHTAGQGFELGRAGDNKQLDAQVSDILASVCALVDAGPTPAPDLRRSLVRRILLDKAKTVN
ncbi:uncharacterized protein AMSG_06512 [Thecamonas trahens ATCC 50062]|uniref:UDENN domain-containing protein n=1 Tax=Thecamonas trahens ATCC 50062 TaxID=461836 RepID=A0A0L0DGB4_THETB|nr:hypothetical protein AMSG_06512 [Thecamonas trahens ATCC 50062]KNC51161.1 hypothetical protein AMSG_06512 [Thecamonas trahens ATCC 50062]|eukprot:XP_013756363.1 hypothetical protein AMSG_06512 [Thecamonas trahens ATCC 50062]